MKFINQFSLYETKMFNIVEQSEYCEINENSNDTNNDNIIQKVICDEIIKDFKKLISDDFYKA